MQKAAPSGNSDGAVFYSGIFLSASFFDKNNYIYESKKYSLQHKSVCSALLKIQK